MTMAGWAQIAVFCAILVLLARPLGGYMTRVFEGERTFLSPILNPIERAFYALAGVDPKEDQRWTTYAFAMLAFNLASLLFPRRR
jgi:K+-transporting ATPase ATPase A chain